jgi:hypothetical protein
MKESIQKAIMKVPAVKKAMRLFIMLICSWSTIQAGNHGTSGYEFLRTDFSPRSSAMAGAFLVLRGDVNGIFQNPAVMAYTEERQFCFNYNNYLLDVAGGQAGYTQRLTGHGQISTSILYLNYGSFQETDEFATPTGRSFSANDMALALSYSDYLEDHFTYGVTLKYIHSKIDSYTASAIGLDLGMIYEASFSKDLYFGIALMNIGKSLTAYVHTKENLPLTLRFGFSKKLAHLPLVYNITFNDLNVEENSIFDHLKKFSIGGEFTLSQVFRLRLGYDNALHLDLNTPAAKFSGVSLGFGIIWRTYRFDYSFSSFGDLGSVHRFGIQGTL